MFKILLSFLLLVGFTCFGFEIIAQEKSLMDRVMEKNWQIVMAEEDMNKINMIMEKNIKLSATLHPNKENEEITFKISIIESIAKVKLNLEFTYNSIKDVQGNVALFNAHIPVSFKIILDEDIFYLQIWSEGRLQEVVKLEALN